MSEEEKKTSDTGMAKAQPSPDQNLKAALTKISEEEPKVLKEMMAFMSSGPMGNPLHQKMEPAHITQVLDLATRHDERQYELTKQNSTSESSHRSMVTKLAFIAFLVSTGVIVLVICLFKDKPEVLVPILTGVGGFFGGAAAGFGIGKSKKD